MNEFELKGTQEILLSRQGLRILYTGNECIRIAEHIAQGYFVPWDRYRSGPPIRIGRQDEPEGLVPIRPEIDLSPVMPPNTQGCVSRLQASLEWLDGMPVLKTFSTVSGTWIRRTGDKRKHLLPLHDFHELKHDDVIQFGHPRGVYVRLRFQFIGNPITTP